MVCLQSLGCCIRPIISQHRYPTAGMGTNPHGLENNISRALPHIAAFVKTRAFRAGVVPATAVSRTNPCLCAGLFSGIATDAPEKQNNAGAPFGVPGATW